MQQVAAPRNAAERLFDRKNYLKLKAQVNSKEQNILADADTKGQFFQAPSAMLLEARNKGKRHSECLLSLHKDILYKLSRYGKVNLQTNEHIREKSGFGISTIKECIRILKKTFINIKVIPLDPRSPKKGSYRCATLKPGILKSFVPIPAWLYKKEVQSLLGSNLPIYLAAIAWNHDVKEDCPTANLSINKADWDKGVKRFIDLSWQSVTKKFRSLEKIGFADIYINKNRDRHYKKTDTWNITLTVPNNISGLTSNIDSQRVERITKKRRDLLNVGASKSNPHGRVGASKSNPHSLDNKNKYNYTPKNLYNVYNETQETNLPTKATKGYKADKQHKFEEDEKNVITMPVDEFMLDDSQHKSLQQKAMEKSGTAIQNVAAQTLMQMSNPTRFTDKQYHLKLFSKHKLEKISNRYGHLEWSPSIITSCMEWIAEAVDSINRGQSKMKAIEKPDAYLEKMVQDRLEIRYEVIDDVVKVTFPPKFLQSPFNNAMENDKLAKLSESVVQKLNKGDHIPSPQDIESLLTQGLNELKEEAKGAAKVVTQEQEAQRTQDTLAITRLSKALAHDGKPADLTVLKSYTEKQLQEFEQLVEADISKAQKVLDRQLGLDEALGKARPDAVRTKQYKFPKCVALAQRYGYNREHLALESGCSNINFAIQELKSGFCLMADGDALLTVALMRLNLLEATPVEFQKWLNPKTADAIQEAPESSHSRFEEEDDRDDLDKFLDECDAFPPHSQAKKVDKTEEEDELSFLDIDEEIDRQEAATKTADCRQHLGYQDAFEQSGDAGVPYSQRAKRETKEEHQKMFSWMMGELEKHDLDPKYEFPEVPSVTDEELAAQEGQGPPPVMLGGSARMRDYDPEDDDDDEDHTKPPKVVI